MDPCDMDGGSEMTPEWLEVDTVLWSVELAAIGEGLDVRLGGAAEV